MFYKCLYTQNGFKENIIYFLDIMSYSNGVIEIKVPNAENVDKDCVGVYEDYDEFKENWESVYERS